MSAAAKQIFNQVLEDVVRGVNALAAEIDREPHEEFAATALAILGLAISKLPRAEREEALLAIEEGGLLRRAVEAYPNVSRPEQVGFH
jgi:hypothetical protein